MCGIAGFVGNGNEGNLREMTSALVHRGPDGEGYYNDAYLPVFLGFRRLSVIDPDGGNQPLWDDENTIAVIFNGEIYNHRALRHELEALGHRFRTDHSDTEVLVHGYKAWGAGMFQRLNGMFALALFDQRKGKVILARDRFGEKPLYYAQFKNVVVFGSELSALLQHPALYGVSISKKALQKFFAHNFFPTPHTPYIGVSKMPPGHYLEIDASSLETTIKRYWRFDITAEDPPDGNPADWASELEHLIKTAVLGRLEADVPLGFLLSGGLDSSGILSFAAETLPRIKLKTFSMGFEDNSFDESAYAETMAMRVGSIHHKEICDLDSARNSLTKILSRLDEPLGDSSIIPTAHLCAFTRNHVTVAISGDGGDELFAGYDPFRVLARARLYDKWVPRVIHGAIKVMAARLPLSDSNMSLDFILNRGLRGLKHHPAMWNPLWLGALEPQDIAELFAEKVDEEELFSEAIAAWDACKSPHLVDRVLDFYTRFYFSDGILTKSDRASMLSSLEVRAPFLDNAVVNFAQRLPWQVKIKGRVTKWILRKALTDHLPKEVLNRKKKGFGMPLARWLKHMKPPTSELSVPHLDHNWLSERWVEHTLGLRDNRLALWNWMALVHAPRAGTDQSDRLG